MMLLVNALQMRLFAAALFFYGMALAVHADYLLYMGVCAGFALLAIPIRVIFAAVEIAELLRGRPSASLFQ
jgi:hypothetical protein